MGKLVRDLIPEIIQASGRHVEFSVLDDVNYLAELHAKLHEEVDELAEAPAEKVSEEIADVLEVVWAIAKVRGLAISNIERVRAVKYAERGGFARRIYLHTGVGVEDAGIRG